MVLRDRSSDLLSERHLPYFLFYSSHHIDHEIIHGFWGKSMDFRNFQVNPRIS